MWGFPKWDFPNKTTFDLVPPFPLYLSHYLKTRHISEDITDVSTSTIFIPRLQQPQSREYSTVAVTASDVMMTRTTDNLTYTLSLFFYKTVYIQ